MGALTGKWEREPRRYEEVETSIGWAVWDKNDEVYVGEVRFKSKRAARNAAKVMNGEDAP